MNISIKAIAVAFCFFAPTSFLISAQLTDPQWSDFLRKTNNTFGSPSTPPVTPKNKGVSSSGYENTDDTNPSDAPTDHTPELGYDTPEQISHKQSDAGRKRRRYCRMNPNVDVPRFPDLSLEESCSDVTQKPELLNSESLQLTSQSVVSAKKEDLADVPNKTGCVVCCGVLIIGCVAVSTWLLVKTWRRCKLGKKRA
jgi:hypothetical protein